MMWIARIAILMLALATFEIKAHEQDLLKTSDINKVMKQILDQHVDQKNFSPNLLQHSLLTYINQFDPQKIYLLESEVIPYTNMSEARLQELLAQYKQQNYTAFKDLNKIIQDAIVRSRKLRKGIEEEAKQSLFQLHAKQPVTLLDKEETNFFAKDTKGLKARLLKDLKEFIASQQKRFGDAIVAQRKARTIEAYEEQMRAVEDQYLFESESGTTLTPAEQENLFTIHVLKALASSLDAHTAFYENSEAYDLRVRLQKEFMGFGLILKDNPQGITVIRLVEDGPAAKSNLIKPGDILQEINGKSIADLSFDKIMEILHDHTQPEISLMLKRPGADEEASRTYQLKLKRATIVLNNDRVDVKSIPFGNGIIGIITLHSFYQNDEGINSEKDVREAVQKLESKGNLKGLILDLRDNSGGFLSQAVKVAGLFITDGIIVISKYSSGEERIYRDVDGKDLYDGPLVVLTSRLTASAAEIVSQALQDYGVALVVGDEHTYGKGTIQTQTVTDNQSSSYFKVTVGKYYTVSGKTPQKEGVKADIIVPGLLENQQIGEEYIQGAVAADQIQPNYSDNLEDIAPEIKGWYLKYYIPKLQHPVTVWRKMIPSLRKNSEYRIAHNKNYQFFLKGIKSPDDYVAAEEEDELSGFDQVKKTYGQDDLQLLEAENIVKDMILMHSLEASEGGKR